LKEKLASVQRSNRRSPEIQKLGKQIEELQIKRDGERLIEIEEELKPLPRYGPEAAALKLEKEEIEERQQKRKEAEEEAKNKELKSKNEKMKTNKARDDKTSGRKTPEKVKQGGRTTSANNLNSSGVPKSETQQKLDKIKERKRMLAQAEKEKQDRASGGRHHSCSGDHSVLPQSFGKKLSNGEDGARAKTALNKK